MNETLSQNSPAEMIIDGSDQSFMADVIQASTVRPILVDFWAPWCGPCKQLTPLLEKTVQAAGGAVGLVKIDMDQNPMVAGQLQIRSIPAVFAFYQGNPVDGFMGALPESQIKAFVDKLIILAGGAADEPQTLPEDIQTALAQIKQEVEIARSLEDCDDVEAQERLCAQLFEIAAHAPPTPELVKLLGHLLLDGGRIDEAEYVLVDYGQDDAQFPALKNRILLARAGAADNIKIDTPPAPQDAPQTRYDAARAYAAQGRLHRSAALLLDLVKTARDFQDDAARQYLLEIMDALEPDDGRITHWRRQLSAILFS